MNAPHKELALAEARLSAPPAERMVKYHDWPQLEREKRMFREFQAVDLAHTTMLVEQGIISRRLNDGVRIDVRCSCRNGDHSLVIDAVSCQFFDLVF